MQGAVKMFQKHQIVEKLQKIRDSSNLIQILRVKVESEVDLQSTLVWKLNSTQLLRIFQVKVGPKFKNLLKCALHAQQP